MVFNVESSAKLTTAMDAVDLLDASFHNNLTAVDENEIPSQNELEKKTIGAVVVVVGDELDDDGNHKSGRVDEDFEAFALSSKRLKEPEELQASLHKIEIDPVTEAEKVEQKEELAAMKEDIKQGLDPTLVVTETKQAEAHPNPHNPKRFVSPKDFELLKVIGMGAFGKVLQVRNKKTKQILAMKVISKRLLNRKSGYVENIQAERNILTRVKHPFIVMMHASFQTKYKLFIIMDFLAGGELFLRLGREGIFLEKTAAFYLAEIVTALEFLHNLGVLHRDLKPENILLGEDGHVCLTDFGLAKDVSGGFHNEEDESRSSTICGTQEYMCPEMIARKGYGRAADYWSLGCIAYEMLNGLPPFRSKLGSKDLFRKIMSEKVKMPDGASAAACKLIKGLLNRNPHLRLGAARSTMFEVGGPAGLKKVDFFKHIDWEKLSEKKVEPPQRLAVQSEDDLKHFHNEFTAMPLPRSVVEESRDNFVARRIESKNFRGFSFIQEGFMLPERDQAEVEKYWNSEDEDGESVSECASSKMEEEPEPVELEKKKRPPRKKKNKVVATKGDGIPAASSVDGGKSPEPSVDVEIPKVTVKATPPPQVEKPVNSQPRTAPAAGKETVVAPKTTDATKSKQTATNVAKTKPVMNGAPKANVSNKQPPVKEKPRPYSLDPSTNQKYAPPQRRGVAPVATVHGTRHEWNQEQRQHYLQQQQPAKQGNGWTVAHQHQLPQTAAPPRGWANQPTAAQRAPNVTTQPSVTAQPSWNTVAPVAAQRRGPAPGTWAAKISAPKVVGGPSPRNGMAPKAPAPPQPNYAAGPPPPPSPIYAGKSLAEMPPSPSSDWRQHAKSTSPRKVTKTPDSWPGLGDFPPPPTLGKPKLATTKAAKPLQGAWGAKNR